MNQVCLAIIARNEEQCLPACLRSILAAVARAEAGTRLRFDVVVVADDCSDRTGKVALSFGRVRLVASSGGKIEAQRRVANLTPFVIFSDADILVADNTVTAVSQAMLDDPRLQVSYPVKTPLAPSRSTLMAKALHCYNRVNGFQEPRRYFNGKFFAIREWRAPTPRELGPRLSLMPEDRFYDFRSPMRVDDIWLSRDILRRHGSGAIREIREAEIWYRPPETFEGMYRTYQRMRREIERLNLLFPETIPQHQRRGYDWEAVRRASATDRWLWRYFRVALAACAVRYRCERFYYQKLSSNRCDPWKPIRETKRSLDIALRT